MIDSPIVCDELASNCMTFNLYAKYTTGHSLTWATTWNSLLGATISYSLAQVTGDESLFVVTTNGFKILPKLVGVNSEFKVQMNRKLDTQYGQMIDTWSLMLALGPRLPL